MLRLIVIGLLLFRLTPIGGELAEALIELVAHSSAPHDDPPDMEHGCTALVHHCPCHSVAGMLRESMPELMPPRVVIAAEFTLTQPQVEPYVAELLRPPSA